jgi:glycosyltransferase involved in cell wall biosynthesis
MTYPLVTVVIPAFNAERYITEALESVIEQTYRPIEIIVVDDGSTDNTVRAVKDYAAGAARANRGREVELHCVCRQNGGPSAARNTGINKARGEYIAFLDADDLWMREKLEKQRRIYVMDPEIDIVFCDAVISRSSGERNEEFCVFNQHSLTKNFFGHDFIVMNPMQKLLRLNFITTSSVIVKRKCFQDGLAFNEERRHAEDWELWLKMSLRYKIGYVNDICMNKHEKGGGLSSESVSMVSSKINVLERFLGEQTSLVLARMSQDALSRELKDIYKWAGYFYMINGDPRSARRYYRKSLKEGMDAKTALYYLKTFFNACGKDGVNDRAQKNTLS